MAKAQTKKPKSFEEALQRLEEIRYQLESGMMPLDQTVKLYTEGRELYEYCFNKLEEAQMLVKNGFINSNGDLSVNASEELTRIYNLKNSPN